MRRARPAIAVLGSTLVVGAALVPNGLADPPGGEARAGDKRPGAEAAKKKKKKKKACPSEAATAKKKKKKKASCPAKPPSTPTTPPSTPASPPSGPPPTPPSSFAPPLDPTIATSMADSAEFLYTGDDPVQEGVAAGTIEEHRVAVLRGLVIDRNGAPLPGVTVGVLDHPELGSTETRSDGAYDIAVNGGGPLVLTYEKDGLLPIERREDVPWQEYVVLQDVAMTPLDSARTTIQSNDPGLQVHRSSVVSDPQGSRRVTMIFKPGTTAQTTDANGAIQALAGPWSVRATEYTVGGIGHNSMPADLPPTSGYTFATELTIDEADTADAVRTDFNNPVSVYVDNFIHAPIGSDMPSGFHHEDDNGLWKADPDGRVMKLISETGGLADLNVDKDGAIDTGAELTALGIDNAERAKLAELYSPGDEFWRVPTSHFSEVDHNTPNGLPAGATGPPASEQPAPEDPTLSCGSIISCEDQTLRERLGVNGTPFSLYYASDRVPGRDAESELDVRVTGNSLPPDIKGVVVQATVAGRLFESYYAPCIGGCGSFEELTPNITWTIPWDGTDVYGRPIQGKVPIQIRINYVYPVVRYETPDAAQKSFGSIGKPGSEFPAFNGCATVSINGHMANPYTSPFCGITVQRNETRGVGGWDARGIVGLGGWSLDVHHSYDPNDKTVHRGDGLEESSDLQPRTQPSFSLSQLQGFQRAILSSRGGLVL